MINLTQHNATPEQVKEGVIELGSFTKRLVNDLLTFEDVSEVSGIAMTQRADKIVSLLPNDTEMALIGGASYFMPYLSEALRKARITPYYSFTKRVIENEFVSDGSVKKTAIFKHIAFIEAK